MLEAEVFPSLPEEGLTDPPGTDLERAKLLLGGICLWLTATERVYTAVTGGAVTNPLEKPDVVIAASRQYILNMWKTSSEKEQ